MRRFSLFLIGGLWWLSGCIDPPTYPLEPEIFDIEIYQDTILSTDSLVVRFSFRDGDGDLGSNTQENPDTFCNPCDTGFFFCQEQVFNIFLFDSRPGLCLHFGSFPLIPAKGSSKSISGAIEWKARPGCDLGTPDRIETVNFSVQIRDRAGNLSNILPLPPVRIRCVD